LGVSHQVTGSGCKIRPSISGDPAAVFAQLGAAVLQKTQNDRAGSFPSVVNVSCPSWGLLQRLYSTASLWLSLCFRPNQVVDSLGTLTGNAVAYSFSLDIFGFSFGNILQTVIKPKDLGLGIRRKKPSGVISHLASWKIP
jgi:hypothetical protein